MGCHFEEQPGDVAELTLDFAKLSYLQELWVKGSSWHCVGVDPGNFECNLPLSENAPKLTSLRVVELIGHRISTYIFILFSTHNLTELISVHDASEVSIISRGFLPSPHTTK